MPPSRAWRVRLLAAACHSPATAGSCGKPETINPCLVVHQSEWCVLHVSDSSQDHATAVSLHAATLDASPAGAAWTDPTVAAVATLPPGRTAGFKPTQSARSCPSAHFVNERFRCCNSSQSQGECDSSPQLAWLRIHGELAQTHAQTR